MAALRRIPAAVVRDQPLPLGLRLVERDETYGHLRVVRQRLERSLQIVEVVQRLTADAGDDAAAWDRSLAEYVT